MTMHQGKKERWYAIRTKPGSQRVAARDETAPADRRDEYVVERQCRKEGIEIYTPSHWIETKHHRSHKILTKRLPLLVGYSFVNLPHQQFERLRSDVDGVLALLRSTSGPVEFPADVIGRLRFEEWERHNEFQFEQHARKERARQEEIHRLRGSLRKIMPKGRAVRVNMVEQADKAIASMPPKVRERVEAILARLKQLTVDETLETHAEAV